MNEYLKSKQIKQQISDSGIKKYLKLELKAA